eukprot:10060951-Lingulodinium_polyedra.AAC.1
MDPLNARPETANHICVFILAAAGEAYATSRARALPLKTTMRRQIPARTTDAGIAFQTGWPLS